MTEPYREPVDLTGIHTDHGRLRAYNFYGCRCEVCVDNRRSYDRDRWELKNRTRERLGRKESDD